MKNKIKNWQLNRKWKKEYGTNLPEWFKKWGKKDITQISEITNDPEFISWYNELNPDSKVKIDRMFNVGFNLVDYFYDKLIEGTEKELIKRGSTIQPDTTRE